MMGEALRVPGGKSFGIPYKEIAFVGSMTNWDGTSQIVVKKDGSVDTTAQRTGGSGSGTYITEGDYLRIEVTSSRFTMRAKKSGKYLVGSGSMESGIRLTERTANANEQLGYTSGNGGCVFAAVL